MADIPTVSVVIPLHNKASYIARAIKSVLSQTFQDFEVIVVDDGSTDGGADIVCWFNDPRIQMIRQENLGASAARNRGIEASHAELIAFLDADDEWTSAHIEILLRLRANYPEAGAYATAYHIKTDIGHTYLAPFLHIPDKPWEGLLPSYFKSSAMGQCPISASTVATPKGILKDMGGFNTCMWWGEDFDLWGRIALKYPIAFSWDGIATYHSEAANRTCNKFEHIEENIFVNTAIEEIEAGNVAPSIQEDLRDYVARLKIECAWFNLLANRPDIARKILKTCFSKNLIGYKYWALFWAYLPPCIFQAAIAMKCFIRHSFLQNDFIASLMKL